MSTIKEAFDQFLSDERLQSEEWSIEIGRAILALHSHGGISVLAHPSTVNPTTAALLAELTYLTQTLRLPLTGLEVYSSRHTLAQSEAYATVASDLGLLITGGSDFHGANKANVPIGHMGGGHEEWVKRGEEAVVRVTAEEGGVYGLRRVLSTDTGHCHAPHHLRRMHCPADGRGHVV